MEECKTPSPMVHLFRKDVTSGLWPWGFIAVFVGLGGKRMKKILLIAVVVLLPSCMRATPAKPVLEVVVLGSGGPRAFGRVGSSYILLVDGTPPISLVAGPGAFVRIGELRVDLERYSPLVRSKVLFPGEWESGNSLNGTSLMDYGRQSSWRTRRRRYSGCRKSDTEHRRILSGLRINPSGCRSRRTTIEQDGL